MPVYINSRPLDLPLGRDELEKIFKDYDKNGDGRLDKEELKQAFKRLGALIPGWRAAKGLRYADANGDGFITEDELAELIKYTEQFEYKIK